MSEPTRRPAFLPVLAVSLLAVPLVVLPSRVSRPVLADNGDAPVVTTLSTRAYGAIKWPDSGGD
jgi:hypothetical protein